MSLAVPWSPPAPAVALWDSRPIESLGSCPGYGGPLSTVALSYKALNHPSPRGAVVICTGWNESFVKYVGMAFALYQAGFSVFLYDHRGQGLSARDGSLVATQNTFVNSFAEYENDLIRFIRLVVPEELRPAHLVLHSMGGLVGLSAAASAPTYVNKVVACAPMLGVVWGARPPGMPAVVARCVMEVLCWFGWARELPPIEGGEISWSDPFQPIDVDLTHDQGKLKFWEKTRMKYPKIAMKGVTVGWCKEALKQQSNFQAEKVKCPVLLLTASDDCFVRNDPQIEFSANAPNCQHFFVKDSYHEVFFERDEISDPVFDLIMTFLQAEDSDDLTTKCGFLQRLDPRAEQRKIKLRRWFRAMFGTAVVTAVAACLPNAPWAKILRDIPALQR